MARILILTHGRVALFNACAALAHRLRRTGHEVLYASPDAVAGIIDAQMSPAERLAAADDVIHNEGDLESLERQVERLHRLYMGLATGNLPGEGE